LPHTHTFYFFTLGNPDIDRITFKTFRHFKGKMEYHRTKDILQVKQVLGHKNIKNTLVYTHLIESRNDEYVTKVAKNSEEACTLIESGTDYILTAPDGLMISANAQESDRLLSKLNNRLHTNSTHIY